MSRISRFLISGQTAGTVNSVTVDTAGTGYTAPVISFTGGGGTGAAADATIDESGTITAITMTDIGYGYTSAPTVVITDDDGSGAAATAVQTDSTEIDTAFVERQGDGTWRFTTTNGVKMIYDGCDANVNALLESLITGSGVGAMTAAQRLFGNVGIA
jgi:hypothetical protein